MIGKTQFQLPSIPCPSAQKPAQHPGLDTNKSIGLRGSYIQNKDDPWTNSSDKYPDPPLDKIQAQTNTKPPTQYHTNTKPPLDTQTLTLAPKDETIPATRKYFNLRDSYGQNKADPWKISSGEVPYSPLEETESRTKNPLNTP